MVSDILTLSIALQGVNNFSATFRQARGEITGLQGVLRGLGAGIKAAAGAAIMIAAMMAQEFIKASVAVATEFQLSMVRIQAITGATAGSFTVLTDKVKQLGEQTMFTRQQVSEGAKQMAMAGLSAQQITASLGAVVSISEVLGLEIGRTAEVMTDLGLAFQMNIADSTEMWRIADVMKETTTSAALSFEQLAQSMTYVSATANLVGLNIAQTSAALAAMANMGIKGSKAGTSLNRAIQQVILPTGTATAVMERLGLTFNALTLESEGLIGVIRQLEERGATAADIFAIFGTRAGRSIASLVTTGSKKLAELTEEIENSTDAVKDSQKEIHKTAAYAYKKFEAAMESAKGSLGEWLNEGLVPLSKALIGTGKWVGKNAIALKFLAAIMLIHIARTKLIISLEFIKKKLLISGNVLTAINHKMLVSSITLMQIKGKHMTAHEILQRRAIVDLMLHNGTLSASVLTTKASTAAHWLHSVAVIAGAKAWHWLTVAISTNPLGAALVAIVALYFALKALGKWLSGAGDGTVKLGKKLKGINKDLWQNEKVLYEVGKNMDANTVSAEARIITLEKEIEALDETNSADALQIATKKKSIKEIERLINKTEDYTQGLHDVLMQHKDLLNVSETWIEDMVALATQYKGGNKLLQEWAENLLTAHNEVVDVSQAMDELQDEIDAANAVIELHEKNIENLELQYSEFTRAIAMATFETERLNDAIAVNDAQIDVWQTGIDLAQNTLDKATQAFMESGEYANKWGYTIDKTTSSIDSAKESLESWGNEIKRNNYESNLLEVEQKAIIATFDAEKISVQAMDKEINKLSDSMNKLATKNTVNTIAMRKIRLAARKEGRDLTAGELADLEQMEIANEERSIKAMETGLKLDRERQEKANAEIALEADIQTAIAGTIEAMGLYKEANAELSLDIQETNLRIMGWEDVKNKYILEAEAGVVAYMQTEYGHLFDDINAATGEIILLEEAALQFAEDFAIANLELVENEELFNAKVREGTMAVWDEIFAIRERNALVREPALKALGEEWGAKKTQEERIAETMAGATKEWWAAEQAGIKAGDIDRIAKSAASHISTTGKNAGNIPRVWPLIVEYYRGDISYAKAHKKLRDYGLTKGEATRELNRVKALIEYESSEHQAGRPEGYQHGGIAEGPESGYNVTLHGKEKIIPLKSRLDGRIETGEGTGAGTVINVRNLNLIVKELTDLDDPIKIQKLVEAMIKRTTLQARR